MIYLFALKLDHARSYAKGRGLPWSDFKYVSDARVLQGRSMLDEDEDEDEAVVVCPGCFSRRHDFHELIKLAAARGFKFQFVEQDHREATMPKKPAVTPDKAIEVFIKIRDEITARKKAFDESIADLKEQQTSLEVYLKAHLNETGADSIKTKAGTAFKTTKEKVSVADWPDFFAFVKDEERWEFLKHDVVKSAVKDYLEENDDLPPGVGYSTSVEVQVRRPR